MVILTGDQGYVRYSPANLSANVDASGATFHMNQVTNGYPFNIVHASPGLVFTGGVVLGEVDPAKDWRAAYDVGNSAALRFETTASALVYGWKLTNCWDSIRFGAACDGFLVDNVWVDGSRDDSIENDYVNEGTVRNSLFEGFTGAMSCTASSAATADKVVTFDSCLVRCRSFMYEGKLTHGSPFKVNSDGVGNPFFVMNDTIIAIENPTHESYNKRLKQAFLKMSGTNCFWLNLSDKPMPADYPPLPSGFTLISGQAARDMWDQKRQAWVDRFNGIGITAPEPTPEPEPDMEPRIAALEAQNAALTALITHLAATVTTMEERVADLAGQVGAGSIRLDSVEAWAGSFGPA